MFAQIARVENPFTVTFDKHGIAVVGRMVHQVWRDLEGTNRESFTVFKMGYFLERPPGWREYRGRLQNTLSRLTHEESCGRRNPERQSIVIDMRV